MDTGKSSGRGWAWFFLAAAIFNFAIGAAGMFAPAQSLDTRTVGLLVFAFGVMYAVVSRNPERYAQVLWAGVFGKVGVVALLASTELREGGASSLAVVLALDVLFVFGFLVFLFTRPEEIVTQSPETAE